MLIMRLLGIDYGEKYIGLAISDEKKEMAFPFKTLENKGQEFVFKELKEICKSVKIEKIIIGLPLNKEMRVTLQGKIIKKFAQELEKFLKISVEFENELFSTKIIEKNFGKNKRINEAAAAILLQSWIDRTKVY